MLASFSSPSRGFGESMSLTSSTSIGSVRGRIPPRTILTTRNCCRWTCIGWKPGSTDNRAINCLRLFRTRLRSTWASAIRRAHSSVSPSPSEAEILRAIASTSSASDGSERTGRFNPCRNAFCAERAFPVAVFGPVLDLALARLARRWRSVVKVSPLRQPRQSRRLETPRPRSLRLIDARRRQARRGDDRSREAHCSGAPQRSPTCGRAVQSYLVSFSKVFAVTSSMVKPALARAASTSFRASLSPAAHFSPSSRA